VRAGAHGAPRRMEREASMKGIETQKGGSGPAGLPPLNAECWHYGAGTACSGHRLRSRDVAAGALLAWDALEARFGAEGAGVIVDKLWLLARCFNSRFDQSSIIQALNHREDCCRKWPTRSNVEFVALLRWALALRQGRTEPGPAVPVGIDGGEAVRPVARQAAPFRPKVGSRAAGPVRGSESL